MPLSPSFLCACICGQVVVGTLSLSHPNHISTTHLARHGQTSAYCSPVRCLKRTRTGMGGMLPFCLGKPWEPGRLAVLWALTSFLDSRTRPSLPQSSPAFATSTPSPPWGSLSPQVGCLPCQCSVAAAPVVLWFSFCPTPASRLGSHLCVEHSNKTWSLPTKTCSLTTKVSLFKDSGLQ